MSESPWDGAPAVNELDVRIEMVIKKALEYIATHTLLDRDDVANIDKISNYAAFDTVLDVRRIVDNPKLNDAEKLQHIRKILDIHFKQNSIYYIYDTRIEYKKPNP